LSLLHSDRTFKSNALQQIANGLSHLNVGGSGNVFGAKNGTLDSTPEALRNRDEDEKYVFPLLRNPIVQSLPTKQVSHPFIYTTDVSSRDEIIKLNNGLNWKQALFGKNAPGYFLSRFPVDPHTDRVVEHVDIAFSLPSENMTHSDFFKQI
jgi:hypothetical protein